MFFKGLYPHKDVSMSTSTPVLPHAVIKSKSTAPKPEFTVIRSRRRSRWGRSLSDMILNGLQLLRNKNNVPPRVYYEKKPEIEFYILEGRWTERQISDKLPPGTRFTHKFLKGVDHPNMPFPISPD